MNLDSKLWSAAIGVYLLSASLPVLGQPVDQQSLQRARELGRQGQALFAESKYQEALDAFDQANLIVDWPSLGLRAAQCLEKLGRLMEAHRRYVAVAEMEYDTKGLNGDQRKIQEAAKASGSEARQLLLSRIPKLTMVIDTPSEKDVQTELDNEVLPAHLLGHKFPVDPGKHALRAWTSKWEESKSVDLSEGESQTVTFHAAEARARSAPTRDGSTCAANQIRIPGGTFWMGDAELEENSRPVHKVTLSPYCIDKTEVTVGAYRSCVQLGGCAPPTPTVDWEKIKNEDKTKLSQLCTWRKGRFSENHPFNCVDWKQATTYCKWAGGRLPTEAEWEYAARGNDNRSYPWGNAIPDASRLNACGGECVSMAKQRLDMDLNGLYAGSDGWPATAPVGSYPKGSSRFGALDMAGNVWEWTADTFAPYSGTPATNPHVFEFDELPRVCRGGGWLNDKAEQLRAGYRMRNAPNTRSANLGFRCVRGAEPLVTK